MSRILAYRDAVIEHLKQALGSPYTIEPHLGRFTEQSLEQSLTRAPAIYVAALGIARINPIATGQFWADTQMLATTIVKDTGQSRRDAGSIDIVEKVMTAIHRAQPGASLAFELNGPTEMNAANLTNPGLEETGVALWAVTWRAEIMLGEADEFQIGPWGDGIDHLTKISARGTHRDSPDDEEQTYVAP